VEEEEGADEVEGMEEERGIYKVCSFALTIRERARVDYINLVLTLERTGR
jgi:hypothetical protein